MAGLAGRRNLLVLDKGLAIPDLAAVTASAGDSRVAALESIGRIPIMIEEHFSPAFRRMAAVAGCSCLRDVELAEMGVAMAILALLRA